MGYASVQLRVDAGGIDGIPHTFLSVTHPDGRQVDYGLVPQVPGSPSGPGNIDITGTGTGEKPHEWDVATQPTWLSETEYGRLMEKINQSIGNPPEYIVAPGLGFPGTNCVGWVNEVWNSAELPAQPGVTNSWVWNPFFQWLNIKINEAYLAARGFIRKDPLALDLDGDGIETRAATGEGVTLFDYDRDGIRTGTGWIAPDDGLVVMDRDGNGSIDSGAELFGVDTVLADGSKAADGFAALRDIDSNHDNLFNASDAAYAQVRIWQDANSDGVSQAAELKTLAQQGISAIRLTATPSGQILSTQNQIAYTGTYDKTNGTTGTAYAINFADNPFTHENAPIPLAPEAESLPEGAGVRDLRADDLMAGGGFFNPPWEPHRNGSRVAA